MEYAFCTFFVFEILVRFLSFKERSRAFCEPWFVFDFVLVLMLVLDTVTQIIGALTDAPSAPVGDAAVLRLFRLLRLTRMTRIMRMVPELGIMVKGMMAGMRSVSIAMFLMACITYGFAIAFRQLTDETEVGKESYSSVPGSAYTLIIEGMLPDNGEMMTQLGKQEWYLGFLFFVYIFLAALTIMNMLIGVLCEVVSGVSDSEKEDLEMDKLSERLQGVLQTIDADSDGGISKAEMIGVLNNPGAIKALQDADVDVFALLDNGDAIFESAGRDTLEFDEFIDVLWQHRATPAATLKCISDLRKYVFLRLSSIERTLLCVDSRLSELRFSTDRQTQTSPQVEQVRTGS